MVFLPWVFAKLWQTRKKVTELVSGEVGGMRYAGEQYCPDWTGGTLDACGCMAANGEIAMEDEHQIAHVAVRILSGETSMTAYRRSKEDAGEGDGERVSECVYVFVFVFLGLQKRLQLRQSHNGGRGSCTGTGL